MTYRNHPQGMACNRCATKLDLQGKSVAAAISERIIVPAGYHSEADCIRHLARAISELEVGNGRLDWRYP